MDRDDGLRGLAHRRWTDIVFEHVELVCHVDQIIDIVPHSSYDNPDQVLPQLRSDFQDHSIVEQHNSRIGPNQNIAGMGICMEEPVRQELIPVKLDKIFDHLLCVDIVLQDLVDLSDAESLKKLHDEYARRRDFAINLWDDHEVTVPEQFREALHIVCLVMEIHLFGDDTRKLIDDRAGRSDDMVRSEER